MSRHNDQSVKAGSAQLPAVLLALLDTMSPAAYSELYRGVALLVHPPENPGDAWRRDIRPLADMLRPQLPPLTQILGAAAGPRARAKVDFAPVVLDVNLTRAHYDLHRPPGARPSAWLAQRYRHWTIALEVAAGLLPDGRYIGRRFPGPNTQRGKRRKARFACHELPAAIRECALALGRVPTSSQYILWSKVQRAIARAAGENVEAACRLPDWTAFRRQYGGWPQALAATHINPDELAEARRKLFASRPLEWGAPDEPAGPRAVLATIDPDDFGELGLTPSQAKRLIKNGFGTLTLSAAASLAHTLDGSLSWLAELADEPGPRCDPGTRLDAERIRAAREAVGASEAELLNITGRTRTEWRALLRGDDDPELREVKKVAEALECTVEFLCS
jgi:hypothetical protein